jgi:hypothetical protein
VVLHPYNSSLNNFVAPPPEVPTNIEKCYETVKTVCANNLHNHTDCGNCKYIDNGTAWEKLEAACGSRPINNFHEVSRFPVQYMRE